MFEYIKSFVFGKNKEEIFLESLKDVMGSVPTIARSIFVFDHLIENKHKANEVIPKELIPQFEEQYEEAVLIMGIVAFELDKAILVMNKCYVEDGECEQRIQRLKKEYERITEKGVNSTAVFEALVKRITKK